MNTTSATTYDQLPLTLSAEDIAGVLGISRSGTYALLHQESFPTLKIGKRMIVPKDKFLHCIDQQTA